ncbi:MAG: hypothetical protein OEO21_06180, partial [Candidatus Krumholzibacteria bacterium]|nr:hypothetical protein [Candidatus Krumholzibacteria bacterium]
MRMFVILALACTAAHPAPAAAPATLTASDVVALEAAGEFHLSGDGRSLVWVKTAADLERNLRRRTVYLTRLDGPETVQLTRGDDDRAPRFSIDGGKVGFVGKRGKDATPQVYVLDLRGGEAEKVTSAATGVIAFDWLDAHTIVYAAREDSTLRERRLARDKDDVVVVADQEHYPPVRLFRVDFSAKRTVRITTNDGVIEEFALSPDRRRVVTRENQDVDFEYDYRTPPRQFLTDLATGARREIVPAPHVDIFDFKWDAAGKGFYCRRDIASDSARTFVAISQLYYYDVEADSLHAVTDAWPQGLGGDYFPVAGGVVAALADGVRDRIAFVEFAPDRRPILRALHSDRSVRLVAAQPDGGRLVFFESTASTIPELMSARMRDGAFADKRRAIDLNEKPKERRLSRSQVARWAGPRRDTVEGILY